MNKFSSAALEYAELGWSVHPLKPDEKKPMTTHGCKDATRDEKTIKAWWAKWPDANIGIATGSVSGIVVLDIDKKGQIDGTVTIKELEKKFSVIVTLKSETPSGGYHIFCKYTEAINKCGVNALPGVDIRSNGGYIVVPPSVFEGNKYSWKNDVPIAEMPNWLVDEIINSQKQPQKKKKGDDFATNIIGLVGVSQGMRNDAIFRYACSVRAKGLSKEEAQKLVLEKAFNCTPPLQEVEAIACLESAWKYKTNEPLTDVGNAIRFANLFGKNVRYVHVHKKWLYWDANRWVYDGDGEIVRLAKSVPETIMVEAKNTEDENHRKEMRTHARHSGNAMRLENMVRLAQSEPGIPIHPDSLDFDPFKLGVINGVVDLKTGDLINPKREFYITKASPVKYDSNASCPTWTKFLWRIFGGNTDLIEYMKRIIGYSLTGLTVEQCLYFLWGTGLNGKSTLVNTIIQLLGDYSITTPSESLMAKQRPEYNAIAALKGARMVSASEVEDGRSLAESLIKQLTGGDKISARFLYGEFFEFTPEFKVWIAGNHKPTIKGGDFAIWRRIKLIPFLETIQPEEIDPNLLDKLLAELPGILNYAIQGCIAWQKEGLVEPAVVKKATCEYKSEMDIIAMWLEDECDISSQGGVTNSSILYNNFKGWADENNETTQISHRKFGMKLSEKGFMKSKNKSGVIYQGITIKSLSKTTSSSWMLSAKSN